MTYAHCCNEWKNEFKKKTLNIATHGKARNNENIKSNNHLNLSKHQLIKLSPLTVCINCSFLH